MVRSFSGSNPFRPQCLGELLDDAYLEATYGKDSIEHLAGIVGDIDAGRCPRCLRVMDSALLPAGSRVTSCRCVPICGPCGGHEVTMPLHPDDWPGVTAAEVDQDLAAMVARSEVGILSDDIIITKDGADELRGRPHPGGWLEYAYDDSDDVCEKES